ncbi:MAG: sigma-70 family RNA polymerase sigma factor [Gemmatimonadaceae bacterium]
MSDTETFEQLTMPYFGDVARFARSLARDAARADDLVQESYLQALRGWHTFRAGADVRRWLLTICHNTFLRTIRREAFYVDAPDDDPQLESLATAIAHSRALQNGAAELLDRIDLAPAIEHALATLPAYFRGAVVLVDVEGQSYEEAALVLGVVVGTVRSRLYRGRRLLQDLLFEYALDAGFASARAARSPTPELDMTRARDPGLAPPAPIDCETSVKRLWDYLDERLPDMSRDEVEWHLAACEVCPPHFTFARTMQTALGASPSPRGPHADDVKLRARVRDALGKLGADAAHGS